MPYVSRAQQGAFHAKEERGEISPSVVNEFDQASKGMALPQKAGKPDLKAKARSIAAGRLLARKRG